MTRPGSSRRSFLLGSGAALAGTAGCSLDAPAETQPNEQEILRSSDRRIIGLIEETNEPLPVAEIEAMPATHPFAL